MLAEEVYLLDNMTYIETESFVSLRGHSTVMARRRAFVDWKKRCNIVLSYQLPASRSFPFQAVLNASSLGTRLLGNCLRSYLVGGEQVLSLRRHKRSGPSSHLTGPLALCNPNEKQKPPPLILAYVWWQQHMYKI